LNKYRDKIHKDAINIMRPSKWGNPFVIGRDGDRDMVCEKHRVWFLAHPEMVEAAKRDLVGKDLVCCCAPKRCHGDTLLEVANEK